MLTAAIQVDEALVQFAAEKGGPTRQQLEAEIGSQVYRELRETVIDVTVPPKTIRVSVEED